MSSEFASAEYKRGFITGMAMNPLFVTTETAPATSSDGGSILQYPMIMLGEIKSDEGYCENIEF